jgi:uncharacterized lipoprotein YajG
LRLGTRVSHLQMSLATIRGLVLLGGALLWAGCGGSATTTTSPTATAPVRNTETFGATLNVGQSQFYSFTTLSSGTTDVTLVSIRPSGTPTVALHPVLNVGLGTPQGTDCAPANAVTAAPGLAAQLTVPTGISIYCVRIADIGNLATAVDYTVRVVHP